MRITVHAAPVIEGEASGSTSHARRAWRRFRRHHLALLGLALLGLLVLSAVFAPALTAYGVDDQDLFNQLQPPSSAHPLGTDDLGRDVLTRLLYGGRISLAVGVLAALLSTLIGVVVGALAGYYGGTVDRVLMRVVDLLLAFPALFLLLILFSLVRASVFSVIVFLGAFGWLYLARIMRAEILSLREQEFVLAARTVGVSSGRIILRHLLPNLFAPIIVSTTLGVAYNMIAEATLSFLGYGVPPEVPTWGNMLTGASSYYITVPLLAIVPGLTLTLAVLAVNVVGDALRDALDPRATL